jgi:alpha-N-arabinofuranosidase
MDGPWQVGHKTADEYGRIAFEAARQMKTIDKTVEHVACGSSGPGMPTFPEWETAVLGHCYGDVDYISLHVYYDIIENDTASFLGNSLNMEYFIKTVGSVCDYIKAKKRGKKDIYISFDEWNVWFQTRARGNEGQDEIYTFEDALAFGTMMNALLRNADRVKIGCQAQLVNVIAPIFTAKGGDAWRQTIFYPYKYASLYGRGTSLLAAVESPKYDSRLYTDVPCLDIAVTADDRGLSLFAVNRDLDESLLMETNLGQFAGYKIKECVTLFNEDLKAKNTGAIPSVTPAPLGGVEINGGKLTAALPKHSWNFIRLEKESRGK